ncbi:MAG: hypothetical protein LBH73_00325 [Spirochaetaceae bacterium]|nr:hypothetical protein [Spirochaetaceae bacterium]
MNRKPAALFGRAPLCLPALAAASSNGRWILDGRLKERLSFYKSLN